MGTIRKPQRWRIFSSRSWAPGRKGGTSVGWSSFRTPQQYIADDDAPTVPELVQHLLVVLAAREITAAGLHARLAARAGRHLVAADCHSLSGWASAGNVCWIRRPAPGRSDGTLAAGSGRTLSLLVVLAIDRIQRQRRAGCHQAHALSADARRTDDWPSAGNHP